MNTLPTQEYLTILRVAELTCRACEGFQWMKKSACATPRQKRVATACPVGVSMFLGAGVIYLKNYYETALSQGGAA